MFPRPPGKNPTGKLKLIIKPRTAIAVETAEPSPVPVQPGTDDGVLKFKLPAGFTLDTNIAKMNSRQRSEATQRVKDVEDRLNKCKPCRRTTPPDSIPNAHLLINNVFDHFVDEQIDPITVLVGHQADNSFKIDFAFKAFSVTATIGTGNKFYFSFFRDGNALENKFSDNIQEASEGLVQWLKQVP